MKPTGNKILVRVDAKPVSHGLIFIPEEFRSHPLTGFVVSMGRGPFAMSPCQPGDYVQLRNSICGYEVFVGGVYHRLVFDGDVIGTISKPS